MKKKGSILCSVFGVLVSFGCCLQVGSANIVASLTDLIFLQCILYCFVLF